MKQLVWEDRSSYSYTVKREDRVPTSFVAEMQFGDVRLRFVVTRKVFDPGMWYASAEPFIREGVIPGSENMTAEQAKEWLLNKFDNSCLRFLHELESWRGAK